jgi:hypothetical protein
MAAAAVLAVLTGGVAALHNVPKEPTTEDRRYIALMLEEAGAGTVLERHPSGFAEQVAAILAVQRAVLAASPGTNEIPLGSRREPADLYRARFGNCFDRSRAIEKALEAIGLPTRHANVYSTAENGSALLALVTPGIESHAVTEVLTDRGWLVVDPLQPWIGLDAEGRPVSLEGLQERIFDPPAWSDQVKARPNPIFEKSFTYVIGLYSRHGRFFPPMTPVPDVNWPDLIRNL